MTDQELKQRIAELEKKNQRLLAFVNLMRDFFFYDTSGSGMYLLSQAQNTLNDIKEPVEIWEGYDGKKVKSH